MPMATKPQPQEQVPDEWEAGETDDLRTKALTAVETVGTIKQQVKSLELAMKVPSEQLRQYLGLAHDRLDPVKGDKRGLTVGGFSAYLQERSGALVLDFTSLASTPEGCEAIVELACAGMFKIDGPMFTKWVERGGGNEVTDLVERHLERKDPTYALMVEAL